MNENGTVFVIDSNKERSGKLLTLIDFIGKPCLLADYNSWRSLATQELPVAVVGAQSLDDTIQLLEDLKDNFPQLPVILVDPSEEMLSASLSNVFAVLYLPFNYNQLLASLHSCQIIRESQSIHLNVQTQHLLFHSLVGKSEAIRKVRKLTDQVANYETSVLVLGESGTGKEIIARTIHALSARANKPFIPINCGAIPAELLESELFGHEKGAFTGAITSRQGRFELADGGTLFLDEIGDMPLAMQVKLLRVLQERSFERVGSNKTVQVDVRIIAATHRNLEKAISEGKFREDLFYRLNVFPIELPSLRSRKEDLPLLINELITKLEEKGKPGIRLLPAALDILAGYYWPGNIRELANLIERLSILFPDGIVDTSDLPGRFLVDNSPSANGIVGNERDSLLSMVAQDQNSFGGAGIDLKGHLVKTELALINQALDEADWIVAHAANFLNMHRTTLVEKMRRYGLVRP